MPSFSSPSQQSSGHRITSAEWNELVNDINYLGSGTVSVGRPAVMATDTSDTSLTSATWTLMTFASESYDTAGMHSTVAGQRSLLTCPVSQDGLYHITAMVNLDKYTTSAKSCALQLRKNAAGSSTGGTQIAHSTSILSTNGLVISTVSISTHERLTGSDTLELFVLQDSGSALTLKGSVLAHRFGAYWVTA